MGWGVHVQGVGSTGPDMAVSQSKEAIFQEKLLDSYADDDYTEPLHWGATKRDAWIWKAIRAFVCLTFQLEGRKVLDCGRRPLLP